VCHLVDDGTLLNGRRHSREDPGGTPDPDTDFLVPLYILKLRGQNKAIELVLS